MSRKYMHMQHYEKILKLREQRFTYQEAEEKLGYEKDFQKGIGGKDKRTSEKAQ